MDISDVLDVGRSAIVTLLSVIAPAMLVGMTVGIMISLFQALTQIQEMTLAFVPKIIAVFASLLLFAPYMVNRLMSFMAEMVDRMIAGGPG